MYLLFCSSAYVHVLPSCPSRYDGRRNRSDGRSSKSVGWPQPLPTSVGRTLHVMWYWKSREKSVVLSEVLLVLLCIHEVKLQKTSTASTGHVQCMRAKTCLCGSLLDSGNTYATKLCHSWGVWLRVIAINAWRLLHWSWMGSLSHPNFFEVM